MGHKFILLTGFWGTCGGVAMGLGGLARRCVLFLARGMAWEVFWQHPKILYLKEP